MRKHFAFIIALIPIIAGCAMRPQDRKIVLYSPPVVFTLQSIQRTNNNCHIAVFEVKNVSDSDMWFTGDGCDRPLYITQYRRSLGWDGPTEEGALMCEMGLERCRVAAGASTKFLYRFWPESEPFTPFRIGLRMCEHENPEASLPNLIYWSDPVYPAGAAVEVRHR